jgi:ATP adenylyltransferase
MNYIKSERAPEGCVFCTAATRDPDQDRAHGVLAYSEHAYALLNRYPYANGHILVVPYAHESQLDQLEAVIQADLHRLLMDAVKALKSAYGCPAMNLGMNMGEAAGAGIAQHLHYHVVPRWPGDTNFMPVVGGTKVQPEDLGTVYDRVRNAWPIHD